MLFRRALVATLIAFVAGKVLKVHFRAGSAMTPVFFNYTSEVATVEKAARYWSEGKGVQGFHRAFLGQAREKGPRAFRLAPKLCVINGFAAGALVGPK
jgi:hypothetical protein